MINSSDVLNAKILIADDQKANVLLLERMLRDASYACIASTMDPLEVSALHRKNRYDLILLDLQMPGMDGFQVLDGLKQIETDGSGFDGLVQELGLEKILPNGRWRYVTTPRPRRSQVRHPVRGELLIRTSRPRTWVKLLGADLLLSFLGSRDQNGRHTLTSVLLA